MYCNMWSVKVAHNNIETQLESNERRWTIQQDSTFRGKALHQELGPLREMYNSRSDYHFVVRNPLKSIRNSRRSRHFVTKLHNFTNLMMLFPNTKVFQGPFMMHFAIHYTLCCISEHVFASSFLIGSRSRAKACDVSKWHLRECSNAQLTKWLKY
jgi:hypothetical protein